MKTARQGAAGFSEAQVMLTFACGLYDRMLALYNGVVPVAEIG
jgi:hypothetical protein